MFLELYLIDDGRKAKILCSNHIKDKTQRILSAKGILSDDEIVELFEKTFPQNYHMDRKDDSSEV